MGTIHEDALSNAHDNHIQDPLTCKAIIKVKGWLESNRIPRWFVDVCFQNGWPKPLMSVEAYGFMRLWGHLLSGELCMIKIPVGAMSFGDQSVEQNQKLLSQIPKPFDAEFVPARGRGADDDGQLDWSAPVVGSRLLNDRFVKETFRPNRLALEVGSTAVSKTLIHFMQGGVARWPYGHKSITVLVAHRSFMNELYGYEDSICPETQPVVPPT